MVIIMELFGMGRSGESALDAFLTDPDLRELWFGDTDRAALKSIIGERINKKLQPLAKKQEEDEEDEEGEEFEEKAEDETLLSLSVSPDEMMAWVEFKPTIQDIEQDLIEELLKDELKKHGIKYGISWPQITRLLRNPIYGMPILVAKGKPAVENQEGAICFHFHTQYSLKPKDDNYGVNTKDPDFISYVKAGTLLCTSKGTKNDFTGRTVRGRVIHPMNGGVDTIRVGENVRMSVDESKWYSLMDGEIVLSGGLLSVQPVLRLNNVDATTGDINFHGSVYVEGNVESGRKVEATENVVIGGVVQDGIIIAGGSVAVGGGIKGGDRGFIEAGGSLRSLFVEYMRLTVKGDIYADVLFGAEINCEGGVFAMGKRGKLISGKCVARQVEVKEIGNPAGAHTEVEIISIQPLEDKLFFLKKDVDEWKDREIKMNRVINETESKSRRLVLEKVCQQIEEQKAQAKEEAELTHREIDRVRVKYNFELRAWDTLYARVSCTIQGNNMETNVDTRRSRIYYKNYKLRIGPLAAAGK